MAERTAPDAVRRPRPTSEADPPDCDDAPAPRLDGRARIDGRGHLAAAPKVVVGITSRLTTATATVRALNSNAVVRLAARFGLAARALVYLLIGVLVAGVVAGSNGHASQSGALTIIGSTPPGKLALWVATIALAGLTLWQWTEAVWVDADSDRRRLIKRLVPIGKSLGFGATGFVTLVFAVGFRPSEQSGIGRISRVLVTTPVGVAVLLVIGGAVVTVGCVSVARSITARFFEEIDLEGVSPRWRLVVRILGGFGYATKGIAFVIIGGLIVVGLLFSDLTRVGGIDAAVTFLGALPFGTVLLAIVAVGMLSNGCYLIVRAIRLRRPRPMPVPS